MTSLPHGCIFLTQSVVEARFLKIFKSTYSSQFLSDWAEIWYNDTDINRSASDFSISPRGARLLKSSNRFTAHNFDPIDLKLSRMMVDISPLNCSEPDFSMPFQGARFSKSSNRFTAYSIDPLWAGLFMCRGGAQNSKIFGRRHCTWSLVSPSQKSRSPWSERWPQRPFGAIFCVLFQFTILFFVEKPYFVSVVRHFSVRCFANVRIVHCNNGPPSACFRYVMSSDSYTSSHVKFVPRFSVSHINESKEELYVRSDLYARAPPGFKFF